MKKKEFTQLKELLPKVIQSYHMDGQMKGATLCHHFRKLAKELWNDSIEEVIQPRSFKNGVLKIAVADSGWAQQVQFKRADIVDRLREQIPGITLKGLNIKVERFSS